VEPWRQQLDAGNADAAWDLFITRYRRLIFATIRRLTRAHDDVLDVFTRVCESLSGNDLARLRRFVDDREHRARFSTWLVAVVRNQTIDWLRERDGRRRTTVPPGLTPLGARIYQLVLVDGLSHAEAYETIATRDGAPLSFGAFLREVSEAYRTVRGLPRSRLAGEQQLLEWCPSQEAFADAELPSESRERVARAIADLAADEQLAIRLFVIEERKAADVARAVGWPNEKAVYNRVYRVLRALRTALENQGVRREDLE